MAGLRKNPLLDPGTTPHDFPNFRKIKPTDFLPALTATIAESRKAIRNIRNSADDPTFENTIEAIEWAVADVDLVLSYFGFYNECINGNKLKKVTPEILVMEKSFTSSVYGDTLLCDRLLVLHANIGTGMFTEAQEELLKKHYRKFERNGALLPPHQKRRLKKLNSSIAQLGSRYSQNTINLGTEDMMKANAPIVKEILPQRYKLARCLGYENYAHMVNVDQMAGAPEKAMEIVKNYYESTVSLMTALNAQPAKEQCSINFDEYFPLDQVFDGALRAAEEFFKVRFVKTERKYPSHQDSVHIYEVHSTETGSILGLFGSDLYRHEGEAKNGTVAFQLRPRSLRQGRLTLPIAYACFDFEYPVFGTQPLLGFGKYLEIFHEIGHCLHSLTTVGAYPSINGVEVKNDFSETQSQFMEFIGRQTHVIQSIARHYKTGEPLLEQHIHALLEQHDKTGIEARLYTCFFATLDLMTYNCDPKTIGDLLAFETEIARKLGIPDPEPDNYNLPNMWHMFADQSSYPGCFHSYPNSEIMAADLYREYVARKKAGPDLGEAFRKAICSKLYALGGTRAPELIYQDIMERAPDLRALFSHIAANTNQVEGAALPTEQSNLQSTPDPQPKVA